MSSPLSELRSDLTPRQIDYLAGVAEGKTYQTIADENYVSLQAVHKALGRAVDATGAANVTNLVAICVAGKLISWRDE